MIVFLLVCLASFRSAAQVSMIQPLELYNHQELERTEDRKVPGPVPDQEMERKDPPPWARRVGGLRSLPSDFYIRLRHNLFDQARRPQRPRDERTSEDLAGLKEMDGDFQTVAYHRTVRDQEVKIHNSLIQNRMLGVPGSSNFFFNLDPNLFSQVGRPTEERTQRDLAKVEEVNGDLKAVGYHGTVRDKEVKIRNSLIKNRMLGVPGSMSNNIFFNLDHDVLSQAWRLLNEGEEKIDYPTLDQRVVRLV